MREVARSQIGEGQDGAIPKLILVNGPPGIGKSTIAARYAADHPLALNLDIDAIRCSLGQWQSQPESKRLARALALEMAKTHLATDHDVVLGQLLGQTAFIEDLARTAADSDAVFHEILLMDTDEGVLDRFRTRRAALAAAGVSHPQDEIDPANDSQILQKTCQYLVGVAEARPNTKVIHTRANEIDAAYAALRRALDT